MNTVRIIVLVLATLVGGAVGYQLGLTQGIASEGGSVVVNHGFGFGFGGFLLPFLLLLVVFAARPRSGWGPGGRDHAGRHGPWHDRFDDWHRRAHGQADEPRAGDPS
jgi:hypothetical protein